MRPHLRGITPSTLAESARRGPLRGSPLLDGLAVVDLAALTADARWIRLARGDHLSLQGSRPGDCWLLLTGYVKEHRPLEDGTESLCGFRGPGDLVGEIAAMTQEPCQHDATALGHGEALAIPADRLRAAVLDSPGLQASLLRAVAARAATAEDALARNGFGDCAQRVVIAVLELADRWGVATARGLHIGIPLTQTELAEWIGVSRETAAKVLHRLREAGIVETSRRRLIVHDVDALRAAVSMPMSQELSLPA